MIQETKLLRIKSFLNAMRQSVNALKFINNDPVQFIHKFTRKEDVEIAGFFASLLAFGRVRMIINNTTKLLNIMKWEPYNFITEYRNGTGIFNGFVHRFVKGSAISVVASALREIYHDHGGLEQFFLKGYSEDDRDLSSAILTFSRNFYSLRSFRNINEKTKKMLYFLMPCPPTNSAYKRFNLFLRWMVRRDSIDKGLWKGVKPSQLIIPLDTHIARISKNIGLTVRRTPDMKMAIEITNNLKKISPDDPLKYDFVLCHMGISEGCSGEYNQKVCKECSINKLCGGLNN